MLPSIRPRTVVFALVLAIVASLPFFTSTPSKLGYYFFEVTLSSNANEAAKVYYDTGHGYNEEDSQRQTFYVGPKSDIYRFPLPTGTYYGLRFDPLYGEGTVSFTDAKIVDREGKTIRRFMPEQFYPIHQIASAVPKNGGLEIRTTPGAIDPYLIVSMGDPFNLAYNFGLRHRLLVSLPAFLFVFFGVLLASTLHLERIFSGQTNAAGAHTPSTGTLVPAKAGPTDLWLAGAMIALVLFKLWLVSAQTIYAIGGAGHDDQLFINLAETLLNGQWLGSYSQFTLMKGPMYSIFIAGTFLLGVPLFTAQHLLYAAGCALVVRALRPLAPHRGLRLALFTVLLFNPVTYESVVNARILRQNILPGIVLIIVAGLIALYARNNGPKRRLLPWAMLTGVALAAFWLTREEGVWLLPGAGLLWATVVVVVWRKRTTDRCARLALLALPVMLWAAGVGTVAWINLQYYGIFTTCEFKQADFKAAFGALLRVEPAQWRPYIAVPREARERLYAVSPAFAELRPYLEGPLGEGWAASSEGLIHLPPKEHEMATGWFMWCLRDAVAAAGHCHNGAEAMAYYARMAHEINEACDHGLVKAGPRRTGFLPPLPPEVFGPFIQSFQHTADYFYSFEEMYTASQYSMGTPEQLRMFADLTRGRLGPLPNGPGIPPKQRWLDRMRLGILDKISHAYHVAAPWTGGAAFLALLAAAAMALARRKLPYFAIVSAALIGSTMVLIAMISLIQVTSFPAINTGYFNSSYGLWLLFMFTSWLALAEALGHTARTPKT
jgi:hypothetical protein